MQVTFSLGDQSQMALSGSLDLATLPQHRVVLDVSPQVSHINIMLVEGMSRLPGGVDGEGIVQIGQVHYHALRGQALNFIGRRYIVTGVVYR